MKINQILENLKQPVPAHFITQKPTFKKGQQSGEVDFISKYNYFQLLDERAGLDAWELELSDPIVSGDLVSVTCKIILHGEDKSIFRSAIGTEEINAKGYGTAIDNAESSAIRRCCSALGLSRDLWLNQQTQTSKTVQFPAKNQPPANWKPSYR